MRRKNNEIKDWNKIDAIIKNCEVCRLALSLNNIPYLIPISFGYDGQKIYIHTATEGKKIEHFEQNNRVCFEFEQNVKLVTGEEACDWTCCYESVIGYGKIEELKEKSEKEHGLNQVMLQYSGKTWEFNQKTLKRTRVWQITIDSITGKFLKK